MKWFLTTLMLLTFGLQAHAKDIPLHPAPSPFNVDRPWLEGTLLTLGLTLWITPSFFNAEFGKPSCDPCSPESVNALDRSVIDYHSEGADVSSDVMVIVIPTLAFSGTFLSYQKWRFRGVLEDMLLIAESMAFAGSLQVLVSHAVRRPRPYMYHQGSRPELRGNSSSALSFYSGHSTTAFAAATSFAYIFAKRHPHGRAKYLVWIASMLVASSVPFLRVASGEHFWTDVIVGSTVGFGMGLAIPMVHLRKSKDCTLQKVGLTAWRNGLGLRYQF